LYHVHSYLEWLIEVLPNLFHVRNGFQRVNRTDSTRLNWMVTKRIRSTVCTVRSCPVPLSRAPGPVHTNKPPNLLNQAETRISRYSRERTWCQSLRYAPNAKALLYGDAEHFRGRIRPNRGEGREVPDLPGTPGRGTTDVPQAPRIIGRWI
jgi:hypothetical protein